MDTTTLVIVFLLVSAATLASYALSHWTSIRGNSGSMGWAATSIGTTMLLTAAAIVVLTFVFRGMLLPSWFGAEQELRETASTNEISARKAAAVDPLTRATSKSVAAASPDAQPISNRDVSDVARATGSGREQSTKPSSQPAAGENANGRSSATLPGYAAANPWAATRCVYVFNPDLGEPRRWKIENGCNVPVAVLLSCDASASPECYARSSTALIFPAKLQRPITLEEQTVYAEEVRYVACFISTPMAVQLIGAPSEERSTATWREQFESARASDGCLTSVQSWSGEGRRMPLPIDAVTARQLGSSVP